MRKLAAVAAVLGLGLVAAVPAGAESLVVVNDANELMVLDSSHPDVVLQTTALTGLQAGETFVGIDYRPNGGELYGISTAGRLYHIDVVSGQAAPVGEPSPTLAGGHGIDFNPVVDRLRLMNDGDQNQRVNPLDGTRVNDSFLGWGAPFPGADPQVTALAYSANVAGASATTLYGIDTTQDVLVSFASPNNGAPTSHGAIGPNVDDVHNGFDIAAADGTAWAAISTAGFHRLFRLTPPSPSLTFVGTFDPAAVGELRGMAVAPRGRIRFDAAGYAAQESAGNVTLTVTRTGNDPTTVTYRTVAGSGSAGADYTETSGNLTWSLGDTSSRTITVPVANDGQTEAEETFTVELAHPTGGAFVGIPGQSQVKLSDPAAESAGGQETGGGAQTTPPDTTAPIALLSIARTHKIAKVARRGLALAATCDEPCTATTQVTAASKTAKRLKLPRRLLLLQQTLPAGQRTKLALKPRRSTARRLRRVKRAFKATISMQLIDAAGNARTVKRTVTLKP